MDTWNVGAVALMLALALALMVLGIVRPSLASRRARETAKRNNAALAWLNRITAFWFPPLDELLFAVMMLVILLIVVFDWPAWLAVTVATLIMVLPLAVGVALFVWLLFTVAATRGH